MTCQDIQLCRRDTNRAPSGYNLYRFGRKGRYICKAQAGTLLTGLI
jgi:hypothetical protein